MENLLPSLNIEQVKKIVLFIVIILGSFIISRILKRIMKRFFESSSNILKIDPTNYKFLINTVSLVSFSISVLILISIIPELKSIALTLFASAGLLTVVIGFASQQAFSNIVSGIFIVIFKPFRVGDIIQIGTDIQGVVEDITLRHTIIKNFENKRIITPNSIISSETIVNSNIMDQKICNRIDLGISYDSNIDRAIEIIKKEAKAHQFFIDARSEEDKLLPDSEPVIVRVVNWADSAVILRVWVWSENPQNAFILKCDILKSVKERFDDEGIEIPFPHRVIINKS